MADCSQFGCRCGESEFIYQVTVVVGYHPGGAVGKPRESIKLRGASFRDCVAQLSQSALDRAFGPGAEVASIVRMGGVA